MAVDLEKLVFAQDPMPKCDCDICAPELYSDASCVRRKHAKIELHKNIEQNVDGFAAYTAPRLVRDGHELMHLTRGIIEYMDRPVEHLNDVQRAARLRLIFWATRPEFNVKMLHLPQEGDGDKLISEQDLRQALTWINEIFFGGDLPQLRFRWKKEVEGHKARHPDDLKQQWQPGDISGYARQDILGKPEIVLFSDALPEGFGSYRKLAILSCLVHEAVHVFLDYYACTKCETFRRNYNFNGHGRAFQLIAVKLEEVFPRLIGIPLKLNRWESLEGLWKNAEKLPSPHDLATYKLQNWNLASDYDDDVFGLALLTFERNVIFKPYRYFEEMGVVRFKNAKADDIKRDTQLEQKDGKDKSEKSERHWIGSWIEREGWRTAIPNSPETEVSVRMWIAPKPETSSAPEVTIGAQREE